MLISLLYQVGITGTVAGIEHVLAGYYWLCAEWCAGPLNESTISITKRCMVLDRWGKKNIMNGEKRHKPRLPRRAFGASFSRVWVHHCLLGVIPACKQHHEQDWIESLKSNIYLLFHSAKLWECPRVWHLCVVVGVYIWRYLREQEKERFKSRQRILLLS